MHWLCSLLGGLHLPSPPAAGNAQHNHGSHPAPCPQPSHGSPAFPRFQFPDKHFPPLDKIPRWQSLLLSPFDPLIKTCMLRRFLQPSLQSFFILRCQPVFYAFLYNPPINHHYHIKYLHLTDTKPGKKLQNPATFSVKKYNYLIVIAISKRKTAKYPQKPPLAGMRSGVFGGLSLLGIRWNVSCPAFAQRLLPAWTRLGIPVTPDIRHSYVIASIFVRCSIIIRFSFD